jgi:hypothetical protein
MPGASELTRRVTTVNANWSAGPGGAEGRFEILLITDDGERHVAPASASEMCALIALSQAPTTLLWDPADDTLIAANIVGRMPWTDNLEQPPSAPR